MNIEKINFVSFKSNNGLVSDKKNINNSVFSSNQVLGITLGTFAGTGILASAICSLKKVNRPILNGFEIGAAVGLFATIATHVYNSILSVKNNNK